MLDGNSPAVTTIHEHVDSEVPLRVKRIRKLNLQIGNLIAKLDHTSPRLRLSPALRPAVHISHNPTSSTNASRAPTPIRHRLKLGSLDQTTSKSRIRNSQSVAKRQSTSALEYGERRRRNRQARCHPPDVLRVGKPPHAVSDASGLPVTSHRLNTDAIRAKQRVRNRKSVGKRRGDARKHPGWIAFRETTSNMKASLGRIELIPILASREQPSPRGDNDTATKSCSKRHLISRRTSGEAAPLALEGRELVRKSLVNAIACAGRVLHPRLASKSLPQLETVSSACSSHSPRFAKKSHAPGRESNTNPTGFRDFVSKRFRQIAKPPVNESLLLSKNLIRRSKNSRGWVASSLLATHENAAATACAGDAGRSGREPGGGLRDAGRGRVRVVDGCESGGRARSGGGIRRRGQQNLPLVRVWGRKAPRNVTRGRFWRMRARWGRPRGSRRQLGDAAARGGGSAAARGTETRRLRKCC